MLLIAALTGFFLLLDILVSLVSSGPRDILATTPFEQDTFGVPNGVGLLQALVLFVAVVLATAAVASSVPWPLSLRSFRPTPVLALGVLAAAAIAGAGAYFAFSGMLDRGVGYDEHAVHRTILDPGSLAVVAAVFLSLIIGGFINRYVLAAIVAAWLVAAAVYGDFDGRSLDGLYLFERPDRIAIDSDYVGAVDAFRRNNPEEPPPEKVEVVLAETQAPETFAGYTIATVASTDEAPVPEPIPMFWVSGAYYTSYLRTATGDVYENGVWEQLELGHLPVDVDAVIPDEVQAALAAYSAIEDGTYSPERLNTALLARPTVEPAFQVPDVMILTPYVEGDLFDAGPIPSSNHLYSVNVPASYYPFSATLNAPGPTGPYEIRTVIPRFAPRDVLSAQPVEDLTYLQVPERISARVLELASRFSGDESPYARANQIHGFLRENYEYGLPEDENAGVERPPDRDPVDWFLFEQQWGGSASFSSAFVVLARAAGIPARVVAGWVIDPSQDIQTVYSNQAHQWAEIALDGIGWVTFDPTRHEALAEVWEEPTVPDLVEDLAESEDPVERERAAETLGDLGEPEALPALVDALENDESPGVQLAAEAALHKIGTEELIWLLLNHEDAEVREAAARGLETAGSTQGVDALRQALANDEDAGVRQAAVDALETVGGEQAEAAILDAAQNDDDTAVREASILALGAMEATWTAEAVAAMLESYSEASLRAAAASALGQLEDVSGLLSLVAARTEDPDALVRDAAVEALGEWGLDPLAFLLLNSEDPRLRAAAATLLGDLNDPEALLSLAGALNDIDPGVRDAALEALHALGSLSELENGTILLSGESGFNASIPGTTTLTAMAPDGKSLFAVRGSTRTKYLRTAVGEEYSYGRWTLPREESVDYGTPEADLPGLALPSEVVAAVRTPQRITVSSLHSDRDLPAGAAPASRRLLSLNREGTFFPGSATFVIPEPVRDYMLTSVVDAFSPAQLEAAPRWAAPVNSPYIMVPDWVRDGRIHDLALEITARHDTSYSQAKAIEEYLRANYDYRFAETVGETAPPPGVDPVEWFLFDVQAGTCGNFSSAFVMLARSIGLPARVVSGWAVSQTKDRQVITDASAHQWAEVAFEGLGWVEFDPTPAGPASRAALRTLSEWSGSIGSQGAAEDLASDDERVREEALRTLEEAGAEVERLENGASIVKADKLDYFVPGTTTSQSAGLPETPLFNVSGAANTAYIRTATGDVYADGLWRRLDPVSLPVTRHEQVSNQVFLALRSGTGALADLPPERRSSEALFGRRNNPTSYVRDVIALTPLDAQGPMTAGFVPVSPDLEGTVLDGFYYPFSGTFRIEMPTNGYTWSTGIRGYTQQQYRSAAPASDPTYLQLPPDLPERVRLLAQQVTRGHTSAYAKAQALANYLRTNYPYRFADSVADLPPPGRDPVDWFLFDHREGTCGVFSSAFAVMARAVGVPARVVSGWAIAATPGTQLVKASQAHQWAEIALDGIGWVEFEPTAPGGPQSRVQGGDQSDIGVELPPPPPEPLFTVTEITRWPEQVRRLEPFTVGGSVLTATGHAVDGVTVEVYVNETKEEGGTLIGSTTSWYGSWSVEVTLPVEMARGPWQLLARTVANDHFKESWSDPDITVISGSGIELTGPARVPVEGEAVFTGRLMEETGSGVEGRELTVAVDGAMSETLITGELGRFTFSHVFDDPGPHWVQVELVEQEYLLGNSARIDLEVTLPTTAIIDAPVSVLVGESFTVTGAVFGVRGEPIGDRAVNVQVGEEPERAIQTRNTGEFTFDGAFDAPGAYTVAAHFPGAGPILASRAVAGVSVREISVLTLDGPSVVELGDGGSFTGLLTTSSGEPIASAAVSIKDASGVELAAVTTDDQGAFEYSHPSFPQSGPSSISATYVGADFIVPANARSAFSVLAPTRLTLEAPASVRDGETYRLTGSLRDVDDRPVPDAEVVVDAGVRRTLTTDADGNFEWEETALFGRGEQLGPHEAEFSAEAAYAGNERLGPSFAVTDVVVGIPRIVLEPLEPVARGDTAELRGVLLLGNRPLPAMRLAVLDKGEVETDENGAFVFSFAIPADARLGSAEVIAFSGHLNAEARTPLQVKSPVILVVAPVGKVRPAELAVLEATLLDDRWQPIPGAVLRYGDAATITDALGVATLEVTVPAEEDALAMPMTFTYDGDGRHMSLSYFVGVPITPLGFNWLLWVGLPGAVAALAAAGYAGRRFNLAPVPLLGRRVTAEEEEPIEDEALEDVIPVEVRVEVTLDVRFTKPAEDLPDVWGEGEEIAINIQASGEDGEPVPALTVAVAVTGEQPVDCTTDDDGASAVTYVASEPGEFAVEAVFDGDDVYFPTEASRTFRVVDFREEMLRLYDEFLMWARAHTGRGLARATPREIELLLVSSGSPVSQRALDELISRFEEADYSEHPIGRRHYESMYRVWRIVREAGA
ncbi:MAG: HEAT repeat domain-containing protein [Chloroflexota bacterium]|nr:HEAT repeat domain-containing protein [Chloroflexota bacterium]